MSDIFTKHFSSLVDPRQSAKVSYPLFDVLFLTVCAVITGAEGWEDIEDFGRAHLGWLQEKGLFEQGLPVHDTIARVISRLDAEQFQLCFTRWVNSLCEVTEERFIAIDGKALRSSYDRNSRTSTIHMVSAFCAQNKLVLGQVKAEKKSNEITAIPEILRVLDLKGCLITIDAMGCQKEVAETIVNNGGDYLLAVKGNQKKLFHAIKSEFSALEDDLKESPLEQQHGRLEIREYRVIPAPKTEPFNDWSGIESIGQAISFRYDKTGKKCSLEYRYYISSKELNEETFATGVREHWGIENSLHWVLDTAFNEDACQIYRENAAQVLAVVRHMAVNMLRSDTTRKASIRRKTKMAAMEISYLEQILASMVSDEQ
ncbi:transposase [Vibrio breoganii]|uniref:ISAs1 family transposase n=1 Tax=Vibrio breoganii TaxID=553239 RepID=UPI000C82331D|nr:ISAs1 family transposase [Vibrio breoganii]PML00499.1 transposase [Vibrio breoganii]